MSEEKTVKEYQMTPEDIDGIVLHGEYVFSTGPDPDEELYNDDMRRAYVWVKVPFSGFYESSWTAAVERENDEFQENLSEDVWGTGDTPEERRKGYAEELQKSDAWKSQEVLVDEENHEDYQTGKEHFTFWVPWVVEEALDANLWAIEDALKHTIIADEVKDADWKFCELDHPKEYNFRTDYAYYWLDKESFQAMCKKEVFENKWYKRWAKRWSDGWDGFISRLRYEDFFDPEQPECAWGVLRFWVTVGLYAKKHFIAPVPLEKLKNLDDADFFNEEGGLSSSVDETLAFNALEDGKFNVEWQLEKAN